MPIWIPLGWFVHKKQYDHMSGALTDRSINMRMGWLFKKQQNIPLDKLTDVSIHEGPILNAFGVVRMQFETAGAAPFILTGVNWTIKMNEVSFSATATRTLSIWLVFGEKTTEPKKA